jgi:hypothetical protein
MKRAVFAQPDSNSFSTAVSQGRLICLSTPDGKRGFFHEAWANGGADWHRIEVPADKVPRITSAFLAEERPALAESCFRQEYLCQFHAFEGLVYPDFDRCVVDPPAPAGGRRLGGIDFGFHNPFAALWGVVDRDGVLWLTGEHYGTQKPLSYHAQQLPRDTYWYADPSGANERCELRCAGFTVVEGCNAIRPGIAAVSARVEDGTLRVLEGACPNLLREADRYRYSDEGREHRGEAPLDEHNHALAALRYLICGLDSRKMARLRKPTGGSGPEPEQAKEPEAKPKERKWLSVHNPALWRDDGLWRFE